MTNGGNSWNAKRRADEMASMTEIAEQMARLANTLPSPRGVDLEKAFDGYVAALSGFAVDAIAEAITRFLSGAFPKVSLNFYPRAPQLAVMVRTVIAERGAAQQEAQRQAVIAAERKEIENADAKRKARTPDEIARVQDIYREFLDGHRAARLDDLRKRKLPTPGDDEAERAAKRAAYGMTEEALSAIKARPLPPGMKQAGDAAPGIPVPKSQADQDAEDFLP